MKWKNKICVSSLRILTHKFCQSDFKKGSEIYESDISSLRILLSCIWFFFCFFENFNLFFFCFFTGFLRVIVLYSCWQFWKMKKKDVGVYVQFHKFRLLCVFACLWNFVLGYLEICFSAMYVYVNYNDVVS